MLANTKAQVEIRSELRRGLSIMDQRSLLSPATKVFLSNEIFQFAEMQSALLDRLEILQVYICIPSNIEVPKYKPFLL